jgi:hypothetical protein
MHFRNFANGFSIFGNAFAINGNAFTFKKIAKSIFGSEFLQILKMHFQKLKIHFQNLGSPSRDSIDLPTTKSQVPRAFLC